MNKMLVLTDFSDNALHAALYAGLLARKTGAEKIILFHHFDISALLAPNEISSLLAPVEATGVFNNYEWASEQIETTRIETLKELDEIREKLLASTDSKIDIESRTDSVNLLESVNKICSNEQVDLVVMGIKGRSGLEKAFIGSNATKAIENLKYPLLIVPMHTELSVPHTLLIATNLKPAPSDTIESLRQTIHNWDAKMLALYVESRETDPAKTKQDTVYFLEQFKDLQPEFHSIASQDVEGTINQFATDKQVSVIVCLHRIRNFFDSLFHKSLTKNLAWHSKIPLLVINAR